MTIAFPELAALRLGFGLSPIHPPPADAAAVLADVAATAAMPPLYTNEQARLIHVRWGDAQDQKRKDMTPDGLGGEQSKQISKDIAAQKNAYLRSRMAACVGARIGFGERLVQFWANHFTVAPRENQVQPLISAFVEQAIRPNIGGSFAQLFTAAETHPGMLTYLDQTKSTGARSLAAVRSNGRLGLNENLAREMLELHSMGAGAPYTQDDVRQLANLLTGLNYEPRKPERTFVPDRVQPGAETVLGKTYGGKHRGGYEAILQAFRDICNRPETARFVTRKLAVHFLTDEPGAPLLDDLAAAWGQDGDLPAVYAVLVSHPDLAATMRQKVRQPFDFIAASLRGLGFDHAAVEAIPDKKLSRWLRQPLKLQGQDWLAPIGPDGWDEAAGAWINPQLLAERIDWAMNAPRDLMETLPEAGAFLRQTLGDTASPALATAVPRAESVRDAVGIVLASGDFNRR